MKFIYQYRTADNVSHTGEARAADRDAVYALLKKQGIRAGRVEEAPGFFNVLFGKGKRWLAIGFLSFAVVALVLLLSVANRNVDVFQKAEDRSQIYGDPAILQRCVSAHWKNVFPDPGDLFLAQFAQPGLDVSHVSMQNVENYIQALEHSNMETVVFHADDYPEVAKIKRIVLGMKEEMGEYRRAGGTFKGYVERLFERQAAERKIIDAAAQDFLRLQAYGLRTLDRSRLVKSWNRKNDFLRERGLPSVPVPEGWE